MGDYLCGELDTFNISLNFSGICRESKIINFNYINPQTCLKYKTQSKIAIEKEIILIYQTAITHARTHQRY